MIKVIETFSGIGAQAKALERIGVEHEIINTCDWDMSAIIAYWMIHKYGSEGDQYSKISDDDICDFLKSQNISMDGKKPVNHSLISGFSIETKRILYRAIKETKNLVSITDVHGKDIPEDIDLLTYSFPCQDLSLCGFWHGNITGISRDANNRSGMLWEIDRILKEMNSEGRNLPRFLVMENVTNILSNSNKADFNSQP